MTDLPEPLTPPDCDLRGYPFTPVYRAQLFGSSFHARVTDSEWRAGVTLWLKSWDQVPAGSLPDDEIDLCRLAELGRDLKAWRKLKDGALHKWIKCSDGRLYHPIVAKSVLEAWEGKRKAASKGKAGAEKRWGSRNAQASEIDSTGNATAIEDDATAIARAMPNDSNRKGQGKGDIPLSNESGLAAVLPLPEPPAKPAKAGKPDPWKQVYDRGKEVFGSSAGGQITLLRKLYDQKPVKVLAKIEDAAERRDPAAYLAAFLMNVDDGGKLAGEYVGGVPP